MPPSGSFCFKANDYYSLLATVSKRALLKVTPTNHSKYTLEQRGVRRLLQKTCGFENQRLN